MTTVQMVDIGVLGMVPGAWARHERPRHHTVMPHHCLEEAEAMPKLAVTGAHRQSGAEFVLERQFLSKGVVASVVASAPHPSLRKSPLL